MAAGKARKRKRFVPLERREEILRLTLMDNVFMNVALDGNIPCVEEMLRVILNKPDLNVKKVQTQRMFQGFRRSVCLDVYAEDDEGKRYNIEIQLVSGGASPQRARFHGGMMDVYALAAGQDFRELPDSYVIFITLNDVLGLGKALYTVHRYIDGDLLPFEDGSHIVYVNGAAEDDGTELWKLIHDLKCANPDEMYFPRLAARARFLKQEEEGMVIMSNYFERLQEQAVREAEKRSQESIALKFIQLGELTLEKIAQCTGLTIGRVRALARTATA